jgi:hypothetical protein
MNGKGPAHRGSTFAATADGVICQSTIRQLTRMPLWKVWSTPHPLFLETDWISAPEG